MKQLAEIIPIILFFTTYFLNGETWQLGGYSLHFNGFHTATAVLMIATTIQVLLTWVITKTVEKRLLLLFAVIMVTGGLTLIMQNNIFFQWKPTIVNWAFAIIIMASQFIGDKKPLMERMLGSQMKLPANIWKRLSNTWAVYFVIVGILNLVVVYGFTESFWVSYKLVSAIAYTIIISIITAIMISPYLTEDSAKEQ